MSVKAEKPTVTVIIPAYNSEDYLQECLDSIYNQTFNSFEIIVVNDGSTDSTLEIIKENAKKHKKFRYIDQENSGQGVARNRAVDRAGGEYILFVDADDFLETDTLSRTVERAEKEQSDFVHFDWQYSNKGQNRQKSGGESKFASFANMEQLMGAECDRLLTIPHFFSVNNLYRKSFLDKNNIRYGEGTLYEDNVFVALIANRAEKITLLPEPLYIVRLHESSVTHTGFHDNRHAAGFIRAMRDSISILVPRTEYTTFYLGRYFLSKFLRYYTNRVPNSYRRVFLREFVDQMARLGKIIIPPDIKLPERIMRRCLDRNIFTDHKYNEFFAMVFYKTKVLPLRDRLNKLQRYKRHK